MFYSKYVFLHSIFHTMFKGYSKGFWLLAIGVLFYMTSFNLLIPELNTIMERLGAGDKKGLVFVFFSISAALARPISGKLSDTIGRKKVMYIGVSLGIITCMLYPYIESVLLFLLLRLAHGFGAGFHPTGATAMVTDLLPKNKRGAGMGIWGVFISVAFGMGQVISTPIIQSIGYYALFFIAGGFALVAGLLLLNVQETLPKTQKRSFSFSLLKLKWTEIIDPAVRPSAILMFLSASCSSLIFVVAPDMTGFLEIENKGIFFGFYTMSTLFIRLLTASLSDKIGRRPLLIIATILLALSMYLLAITDSKFLFLSTALIYGVASGLYSPTLMAWMADLSDPKRRGIGSGTLFIALEGGFMFGPALSMFTYQSTIESVYPTFLIGVFFCCVSLLYLLWHIRYFHEDGNSKKKSIFVARR